MNKKAIIITMIILVIIGIFCYCKFFNFNKNKNEENISSKANEVIINTVEINDKNETDILESAESKEVEQKEFSSYNEEKIKEADKPNLKESDIKNSDVTINVGDYEIRCGKYKGTIQVNGESREMIIEITEDNIIRINNQDISFSIGSNRLICDNGSSFQITGNNNLIYEVEDGIEFKYAE